MANFKVKVSLNTTNLKKVVEQQSWLIKHNIEAVLRNQAIPHLIDLIMIGYDALSDLADLGPDDPTNPSNWREEFYEKLQKDLEDTFIVSDERITVKLGDKEFLGYTGGETIDPDDTEPLHWLVFYIEGLAGDWGFITPDTYEQITHRTYQPGWGRFEEGFMISRDDYDAQGWNTAVPFEQVRHPFSGFAPVDIFSEALNEFRLRPFIDKAITAATQGRRL